MCCVRQVPDSVIRRYNEEWKVYAPGFVGANSTGGYGFLDHEFFKVRLSKQALMKRGMDILVRLLMAPRS